MPKTVSKMIANTAINTSGLIGANIEKKDSINIDSLVFIPQK